MPTGTTHIALRIGGSPLLIFDQASDLSGRRLGHAVVGGARTAYHVRDVSLPSISVGAMLRPALANAFFRPGYHDERVAEMMNESGLSHRHCIALFRQVTGLAPRQWLRLQRFAHALELAADPSRGWAEIAAAAGFADQAHLANTFSAMTGFTPSAWRRRADPATPHHVLA
ncbi:MAG: AraC family transcriptional regulator [Burkholderiaceae bacterium]